MRASLVSLVAIISIHFANAQSTIHVFGSTIVFVAPATTAWSLAQSATPNEGSKGVQLYKHVPIKGSKGSSVEPVIALVYEQVLDSIDVIEYSLQSIAQKPFRIKQDLLGGYPDFCSDSSAVVFKGEYYRSGVAHRVFLAYLLHDNVGVEIIADATSDIFKQVQSDMKAFIKSVRLVH